MAGWFGIGMSLVKEGFDWLRGRQDRKQAADKIKAKWEVAQIEKFPWFISLVGGAHIIGPIDWAFYEAWKAAKPIESPQEVAQVVDAALSAFPVWWTGAFVTIILALMGIRANGQEKVNQARAREREHEAQAKAERETRNRQREEKGEQPLSDRPGPPGGGK